MKASEMFKLAYRVERHAVATYATKVRHGVAMARICAIPEGMFVAARSACDRFDGTLSADYVRRVRTENARRMAYFRHQPARPETGSLKSGDDYVAMIMQQHAAEVGGRVSA